MTALLSHGRLHSYSLWVDTAQMLTPPQLFNSLFVFCQIVGGITAHDDDDDCTLTDKCDIATVQESINHHSTTTQQQHHCRNGSELNPTCHLASTGAV